MDVAVPPELADWTTRVRAAMEQALVDPEGCCTFLSVLRTDGADFLIRSDDAASRVWGANDLDAQQSMARALVAAGGILAFAWATGGHMQVGENLARGAFGAHVEWKNGPAFRWNVPYERRERRVGFGLGALRRDLTCGPMTFAAADAFAFPMSAVEP